MPLECPCAPEMLPSVLVVDGCGKLLRTRRAAARRAWLLAVRLGAKIGNISCKRASTLSAKSHQIIAKITQGVQISTYLATNE